MDVKIEFDPSQLEGLVISAAEKLIAKQQVEFKIHSLPLALSREELCRELGISMSTAVTLFRRKDFPVVKNLGGTKVVTHLLLKWLEKEAGWIEKSK